MKYLFALTAAFFGLTLGAGWAHALDSGCPICDCNTASTQCILKCQGTSDFVKRQQCQIACDRSYSSCLTAAYAAISAAEEAANQAATTTTSTTTTSTR
ncbi:hypothetical protein [Desulfolutivibrio sulfoxidireducens]|uniref:hypothetical protein n=1 Tax=Desulfolutivibrio sulfoxidireducens TaxID=2773299 RepID=UPI00159EAFB2|nr:hypothetical protein [Desulfolutivibrio sulfoxidireducens]QLA17397.1 hypothetical protein GD605_15545 [Desulfolutivibrio sulfoxidireducens]QLA20994.1 hypothetical protein GD604_15335 [Desulfolutivibrio sulfoxidireducens]